RTITAWSAGVTSRLASNHGLHGFFIRHTPSGVRRISSHKRSLQPSIANWSFGFCVSESTRQMF
ncbi:hypothetical protein, partial [Rubripirellula amarantea]|uniref:hypothetical protein n=1 Tax=Rubripirellula amarantea TaxID=2527999 RepID=UPI001A954381